MRLIDADKLENTLSGWEEEYKAGIIQDGRTKDLFSDGILSAMFTVFGEIKKAPTVDAVPVVHASWGNWKSESGKVAGYVCNNCGFVMLDRPNDYLQLSALRYCPNCGCKMIRGKKDEDSQNIRDYIHNQKFLG